MAYASWSVVFGEQPSASKWNILGSNDASFNDGTGIAADAITGVQLSNLTIVKATSTPVGDADTSGSWADWGASTTVAVPSWANRAMVVASIQGYIGVTSGTTATTRVVIGSDTGATSGALGHDVSTGTRNCHVWVDLITLTGTGSVTLKNQVIETGGTGALRVSTYTKFDWFIIFLAA